MTVLFAVLAFEGVVRSAAYEAEQAQSNLSDRCSLGQYANLVRTSGETNIWTDALQTALREHQIVEIPASDRKYYLDATVVLPSDRRIEATGATLRLVDGVRTVMFRNEYVVDGTLRPILGRSRNRNIAIEGGRFEDWCRHRVGYGGSGRYDESERRVGNFFGVSTLFFFNNCDCLQLRNLTIANAGGFAVQTGDGDAHVYENVYFDRCFADGLHLNGNLSRVLVRNVRGQVGDDLVAFNAYDWLKSSVDFGPQRDLVCEDLELIRKKDFSTYPAIRLQPAKYRYEDGTVVDCSISNIVLRNVRGITTFKGYFQTPRYEIGNEPEWGTVGSGWNWNFENVSIDLENPIDMIGQYRESDPVRGHFGAFEFGANLKGVHFRNVDIRFHADKYPLSHLITVGPKSCTVANATGRKTEVFDPYVSCKVEDVTLADIRTSGTVPSELVHVTAFDDINGDGRSTGRGKIIGLKIEPWKMFDRRLGMFIHWGIYSVGGFHEQERMRLRVPRTEYEKCAERFAAEKFDADKFVDAAELLGAEYIVFTAKHHDGFCMWDTKTTDFKVTNTPTKRDIVGELAAACKRRGMKLGLYYSNPDWHHPNAYNPLSTHQIPPEPGDEPDMAKYREYVKAQITELLTNYGEIVCLFWDIPTKIAAPEMDELVRRLQPCIMINDRGWGNVGDYSTPERDIPAGAAFTNLTEACDSVGMQSWGYRVNEDYRTIGYLTRGIDSILSRGGSFLLNVGPKSDGTIPDEVLAILQKVGAWYRRVRESYSEVELDSGLVEDSRCLVTRRGREIYLHYPKGLDSRGLDLKPLKDTPQSVTLLNRGQPLDFAVEMLPCNWHETTKSLHIWGIPADELANESVVIRICL